MFLKFGNSNICFSIVKQKTTPGYRLSDTGSQVFAAMASINKGHTPSTVDEDMVALFKTPQSAVAAAKAKTNELKLVCCSLNISQKRTDKSLFCCKREFNEEEFFWWLQPHIQYQKDDNAGFIAPAWFVETTKEKDLINMEINWKEKNGVYVPVLQNCRPLKLGDRLYRAWSEQGAYPEEVHAALARQKKRQGCDSSKVPKKAKT